MSQIIHGNEHDVALELTQGYLGTDALCSLDETQWNPGLLDSISLIVAPLIFESFNNKPILKLNNCEVHIQHEKLTPPDVIPESTSCLSGIQKNQALAWIPDRCFAA